MGNIDNKKFIMRIIYTIWVLRKILHPLTLRVLVVGAFLWQLTAYVSLKNIAVNWPLQENLFANYKYIESAFLNTESVTVLLIIGVGFLSIWFARDLILGEYFKESRGAYVRA